MPGSITYTTSTNPDGQVVYHPFKSVALYSINSLAYYLLGQLQPGMSEIQIHSDLHHRPVTKLLPVSLVESSGSQQRLQALRQLVHSLQAM